MQYIKQGASGIIKSKPIIILSSGLVNALATIQKANVLFSANGGALTAAHANQGTADVGAAYDAVGCYNISYDATDSATLGMLTMVIGVVLCTPIQQEFMVLSAAAYDFMFGTTSLPVNVTKWLGTAAATPAVAGIPQVEVANIDTDAINSAALATTAVTEIVAGLNNLSAAQVTTAVAAYMQALVSGGELTVTPAKDASPEKMLQFLFMRLRNAVVNSASLTKVAKDDGTVISQAPTSSDGSTFTRGKFVNP